MTVCSVDVQSTNPRDCVFFKDSSEKAIDYGLSTLRIQPQISSRCRIVHLGRLGLEIGSDFTSTTLRSVGLVLTKLNCRLPTCGFGYCQPGAQPGGGFYDRRLLIKLQVHTIPYHSQAGAIASARPCITLPIPVSSNGQVYLVLYGVHSFFKPGGCSGSRATHDRSIGAPVRETPLCAANVACFSNASSSTQADWMNNVAASRIARQRWIRRQPGSARVGSTRVSRASLSGCSAFAFA
jgi:hypothetical protein